VADHPAYEALVDAWLTRPGVSTKRMLHNEGLAAANGQVFCFPKDDDLVVKLPSDRIDALEAAGRGARFAMASRVMREWARLPAGTDWAPVVEEAHAFVAGLPTKKPRAPKQPKRPRA
jgi:hypothetical protein